MDEKDAGAQGRSLIGGDLKSQSPGLIANHLQYSYETSPDAVQTLTFYSKHSGKTLRFGPKHSPNVASRRAVTREWSSEHDKPSPLCCNCAVVTLGLPPYRAYVETYELYRILTVFTEIFRIFQLPYFGDITLTF